MFSVGACTCKTVSRCSNYYSKTQVNTVITTHPLQTHSAFTNTAWKSYESAVGSNPSLPHFIHLMHHLLSTAISCQNRHFASLPPNTRLRKTKKQGKIADHRGAIEYSYKCVLENLRPSYHEFAPRSSTFHRTATSNRKALCHCINPHPHTHP